MVHLWRFYIRFMFMRLMAVMAILCNRDFAQSMTAKKNYFICIYLFSTKFIILEFGAFLAHVLNKINLRRKENL